MPGLDLRLTEERDGDAWQHAPDVARDTRTDRVDVRSKLTLSFGEPPSLGVLEADPEWRALDEAVVELERLAHEYVEISRRAASLPPEGSPETPALQQDATRVSGDVFAFLSGLKAAPGRPGIFANDDEVTDFLLAHDADPYAALIAELQARRRALVEKARAAHDSSEDVLVTVRALLDPLVGDAQFLQVPDYYEKSKDELADDLERARNRDFDRLKAEYDASRQVAESIRELQQERSALREAVRDGLDKARVRVRELEASLRELIEAREAAVRAALDGEQPDTSGLTAGEQAAWEELMRFVSDVRALRDVLGDPPDADSPDPFEWVERVHELVRTLTGTEADDWPARLASLADELETAATDLAAGPVKESMLAFAANLRSDWKALLDGLAQLLPATQTALETLTKIGAFEHAVDGLPAEDGAEVPHPGDDLPDAQLDLRKNPITHGDELKISVSFWRVADYEARRRDPKADVKPIETIEYTSEAIEIGWRWSGDVIFTRQFDGPFDDHFEANAGVSREYHWFDRDDPGDWVNDLDPGVGFHAAQLNMDPDESVEFGVGLNASLWDGLLRGGVGYNVSIDEDHTYWFFGFGLISALDRLDQLRNKAFGDGD